jgi:hypothetical protein
MPHCVLLLLLGLCPGGRPKICCHVQYIGMSLSLSQVIVSAAVRSRFVVCVVTGAGNEADFMPDHGLQAQYYFGDYLWCELFSLCVKLYMRRLSLLTMNVIEYTFFQPRVL